MKRVFLLLGIAVILLQSSLLFSGPTEAYPVLQVAVTPTAFYYFPFVAKNWSPPPVVYDLDEDASAWGVYPEGSPTWTKENVAIPSIDGNSLRCSITGGDPYSNVHCYRNLLPEPDAERFTLTLSFWFSPTTTYNNEGGPSVVQALEFAMNKWHQSKRYEFALQWQNVGDGAPQWRYWNPHRPDHERWVGLGIADELEGEQWHYFKLEGEIVNDQVHYLGFCIDQQCNSLDMTVPPADAPGEPDCLAVAFQLDGNSAEDPYDVFVDKVSFVRGSGEVYYRMHGVNFSPYIDDDEDPDKGGDQITDEELGQRMGTVAPHTEWIRAFGCNKDLKEAGMFAHAMGLKAAIGAWLGREPGAMQENQNQIDCLVNQAIEGHVDIAIVGSEVLLRGDLSETDLISYINQVKQRLQEAGIDIPVTYADIYGVLLDHPNVISAIDLVFANYYPYWEGRKIDYAVAYVHRWHQQVVDAASGKEVIVSETGWPSCGNQIGEAVPSLENASFYRLNFVSWARASDVEYFYFEAFDEGWKARHEGPQGACWGIWDREGNLKPGMQRVFDGETIDDNWSDPIPEAPIIDFPALPELTETNIPTFVVAGSTEPGNEVWLNGTPLPPDSMDEEGNFAAAVPLVEGDNVLELVIKSGEETIATAEKTVRCNEDFSTGGKRLIYVDSVSIGEGIPALLGTVVIDLDNNTLLGLIEDKHVVGISPDGREIYTSDRTVITFGASFRG